MENKGERDQRVENPKPLRFYVSFHSKDYGDFRDSKLLNENPRFQEFTLQREKVLAKEYLFEESSDKRGMTVESTDTIQPHLQAKGV